ncbi:MAG: hypothetical protein IJZ07_09195 [Clostridia bacterium]|nr:hypothetical protein [Clostridia bacterium]
MKKTVSMLLAVLFAAIAVCTFATSAFAVEITDPSDGRLETTTVAPTTAAPTTAAPTTAAPTTAAPTTAADTTAAPTTAADTTAADTTKFTLPDIVVTLPEGVTVIDEGTTKAPATTKKPTTTKKPAANISTIPNTGSSAAPVIALLALAAGTVAVVKTKKGN